MTKSGCALSVVIPTYRKAASLDRTLAALADCEAPSDWEVVVVDDGSGEGATRECLERWRTGLPLVDASLEVNRGRAGARNHGWRHARGEVVLFLDDDIVLERGALVAHCQAQSQHPAVYLGEVVTAAEIIDSPLFRYLDTRGVAKTPEGGRCPARYFLTQNASVPRRCLEEVGGFDDGFEAYGFEDMELAFRLEDRCGLAFFHLGGAIGQHVHHHRLDEYLAKKVECGQHTLPRICRLHPGRVHEMHLDVLPGLREQAPWTRRLQGALLDLLDFTGLHLVLQWKLARFGRWAPERLRHRGYDLLVLCAYARGLRRSDAAKMAD